MRLLNTLKYFKILLVIFMMAATNAVNATIDPTNNNKTPNKEQVQDEQNSPNATPDSKGSEELVEENEEASREDGASISNSSFNYFFYLIYKIKFADIFNLPNNKSKSIAFPIPDFNINSLLKRLISPEI